MAVGVVDMALHDLAAKAAGVPLYRWISDHYGDGEPDESVFVYAAGGYYAPGKSDRDLQDEMRRFLDAGYRHLTLPEVRALHMKPVPPIALPATIKKSCGQFVASAALQDQFFSTPPGVTSKPIADAHSTSQVLICVSADSRDGVDTIVDQAVSAGGRADRPA